MRLAKIIVYALLASFVLASVSMFVGCSSKKKITERYDRSEKSVVSNSFSKNEIKDVKKDCTAITGSIITRTTTSDQVNIKPVDPDKPGSATKTNNADGSTSWELNNAELTEKKLISEISELKNDSIRATVTDNSTKNETGSNNAETESQAKGRNSFSDSKRFATGAVVVLVLLGFGFLIFKYLKK